MESLLSMADAKDELWEILDIASALKSGEIKGKPLTDKYLGMVLRNHQHVQGYLLKWECTSLVERHYIYQAMICKLVGENLYQILQGFFQGFLTVS